MAGTASLFVGVNEGYDGDNFAVTDPYEAVSLVDKTLKAVTSQSGDGSRYQLYPGLAVYNPERGCPKGGEIIVAVVAEGAIAAVIETARELRRRLKQSTLFVAIHEGDAGQRTRGFTLTAARSMREVGAAWQVAATEYNAEHGLYVPCGVYDTGTGDATVHAEANPGRFPEIAKWEAAAGKIAQTVGERLGTALKPSFRDTGFVYMSPNH